MSPATLVQATTSMAEAIGLAPAPATVHQHVGEYPRFIPELPLFRPVIDGELLTADPIDIMRAGLDADIDLLIGHDAHEIDGSGLEGSEDKDLRSAFELMGFRGEQIETYSRLRPDLDDSALFAQAVTDVLLRLWSIRAADARAPHHPGRTYAYEFSFGRSSHGMDVPYLWDTLDALGDGVPAGAQEVASDLHASAVRFIATGDAGWPAYDCEKRMFRIFGDGRGLVEDPLRSERSLWEGVR